VKVVLHQQFDPPARRLFANGFPYAVIYVVKPDAVWIITIMHVRLEPGDWKERSVSITTSKVARVSPFVVAGKGLGRLQLAHVTYVMRPYGPAP
jgi:hypothetical protein